MNGGIDMHEMCFFTSAKFPAFQPTVPLCSPIVTLRLFFILLVEGQFDGKVVSKTHSFTTYIHMAYGILTTWLARGAQHGLGDVEGPVLRLGSLADVKSVFTACTLFEGNKV